MDKILAAGNPNTCFFDPCPLWLVKTCGDGVFNLLRDFGIVLSSGTFLRGGGIEGCNGASTFQKTPILWPIGLYQLLLGVNICIPEQGIWDAPGFHGWYCHPVSQVHSCLAFALSMGLLCLPWRHLDWYRLTVLLLFDLTAMLDMVTHNLQIYFLTLRRDGGFSAEILCQEAK